MSEHTDRVREKLVEKRASGTSYVKSKHIADELEGLSAKQVAWALVQLEDEGVISRWSEGTTGTTWKVDDAVATA